jgi:flavodoxin
MSIFYFTTTGNCLYIAKNIGGELLSIPQIEYRRRYQKFQKKKNRLPFLEVAYFLSLI